MLTSSARVELVPAESLGYSRWPMLGGRARLWDSRGVVECLKGGGDGCKALNEVVSIDKAYVFEGECDVATGCL